MFERFAKLVSFIWSNHKEYCDAPAPVLMFYDLVINYVDEDREPNTKAFRSAAAREAALPTILKFDYNVDESDEGAIASLVFEDRLVFWQRSRANPTIPDVAPALKGLGEKVLRVGTTGNGTVETIGYDMRAVLKILAGVQSGMVPVDAAVVLRQVAYQRKQVLVNSRLQAE